MPVADPKVGLLCADRERPTVAANAVSLDSQAEATPLEKSVFAMALPIYAGLIYIGAAMVLLGVLLPRIALLHHLSDNESGLLLMAEFAATATGGLVVRGRLAHVVVGGYVLVSAGLWAAVNLADNAAVLGIGAAGLGLGMVMTATNLLVCRMFPHSRGAALSVLNFVWSVGATFCPVVIAQLPAGLSLRSICGLLAAISTICAIFVSPAAFRAMRLAPAQELKGGRAKVRTIVVASTIAFLYVGTEATLGGWMSTYAGRSVSWGLIDSEIAAAWFWGALLLGRGIAPFVLQVASESKMHLFSIVGAGAGVLLIVSAHSPAQLLIGAGMAGFGLAPVFPLTISLFMRQAAESKDASWVLGLAGFGGAILPWLAGAISSLTQSLRAGLMVAIAAISGMSLLTLVAFDRFGKPIVDADVPDGVQSFET